MRIKRRTPVAVTCQPCNCFRVLHSKCKSLSASGIVVTCMTYPDVNIEINRVENPFSSMPAPPPDDVRKSFKDEHKRRSANARRVTKPCGKRVYVPILERPCRSASSTSKVPVRHRPRGVRSAPARDAGSSVAVHVGNVKGLRPSCGSRGQSPAPG